MPVYALASVCMVSGHSMTIAPTAAVGDIVAPRSIPETRDGASPAKYRPDIDGLRAVAILLVVIFHFQIFPAGKAGFMGVDVFFVISGFLITSIIHKQLARDTFRLGTFYLHRIRRLSPALLATLLLTLAAGFLVLFPDDLVELSNEVVASQLYVANIYFWRNVNYFGLAAENVFLLHMWSLAVEEQYYLLYPLTLLCIYRFAPRYFWPAIALGGIASFILNVVFVASRPEATFYLLPTRAWELLVGGLIPFAASRWRRSRTIDEILALAGTAAILVAVTIYTEQFRFPGAFALLPVLGSACLILSGESGTTLAARVLSHPIVVYIGKISYPLYLVHWPVRIFASRLFTAEHQLPFRLALLASSILLAAALYHLVENPVRRRYVFDGNKHLVLGYGTGVGTTLLVLVAAHGSHGFPARFAPDIIHLANYVNDRSAPLTACEFTDKLPTDVAACRLGAPGREPAWIVFGDSHAWAAHDAFDRWLAIKGESAYFMFRNSCPPVIGVNLFHDKGVCFAFNRSVGEFLKQHRELKNVVMVSTWQQAPEARLSTSPDVLLSRQESISLLGDRLATTLASFNAEGKRVYLWEPVPGAKGNVPLSLARAALEKRPADLEYTPAQYAERNSFFFSILEKLRPLIAVRISPSQALCESGTCAVTIAGVPAYFDNNHITRSTADFWVQVLQRSEAAARTGQN